MPFAMSWVTVRSATSIPSFKSSPWTQVHPDKVFDVANFLTSARTRHRCKGAPVDRIERWAQYSWNRRRCQRMTVSG